MRTTCVQANSTLYVPAVIQSWSQIAVRTAYKEQTPTTNNNNNISMVIPYSPIQSRTAKAMIEKTNRFHGNLCNKWSLLRTKIHQATSNSADGEPNVNWVGSSAVRMRMSAQRVCILCSSIVCVICLYAGTMAYTLAVARMRAWRCRVRSLHCIVRAGVSHRCYANDRLTIGNTETTLNAIIDQSLILSERRLRTKRIFRYESHWSSVLLATDSESIAVASSSRALIM